MEDENQKISTNFSSWLKDVTNSFQTLIDDEKTVVLETLISKSGPNQLTALSELLPNLLFRDFVSLLPTELVIYILFFLDGRQLLLCCQVCHSWNDRISSLSYLWEEKARQEGASAFSLSVLKQSVELVEDSNGEVESVEQKRPIIHNDASGLFQLVDQRSKSTICSPFKSMYLCVTKIIHGIENGVTINTHLDFIDKGSWRITLLSYQKGTIITGSDDHCVQLWSASSGTLKAFIPTDSVCCITHSNTHLYVGSFNSSAASWDITTGIRHHSFMGHTSAVFAIDVTEDEKFVLTGSADKTAKVWDKSRENVVLLFTLFGVHQHYVLKVKFLPSKSTELHFVTCSPALIHICSLDLQSLETKSRSISAQSGAAFTSFYFRSSTDLLYACEWDEDLRMCWISKFETCLQAAHQKRWIMPMFHDMTFLLGAGRKFAVVACFASRKGLQVIDLDKKTVVTTIRTPSLYIFTPNISNVTLCDATWLDGFSGTFLKANQAVFAACTYTNTVVLGTWNAVVDKMNKFGLQKQTH